MDIRERNQFNSLINNMHSSGCQYDGGHNYGNAPLYYGSVVDDSLDKSVNEYSPYMFDAPAAASDRFDAPRVEGDVFMCHRQPQDSYISHMLANTNRGLVFEDRPVVNQSGLRNERSPENLPAIAHSGNSRNSTSSISNHLHSVLLSDKIPYKSSELLKILKLGSLKELSTVYTSILENIFGVNDFIGWDIGRMKKLSVPRVHELLAANGLLLSLASQLGDQYQYQFKATTLWDHADGSLRLNGFEYFIFSFCNLIFKYEKQGIQNLSDQSLYIVLLEEYLAYFLPLKFATPICGDKSTTWEAGCILNALTQSWLVLPNPHPQQNFINRILQQGHLASVERLRLIRILVKHFHYFSNQSLPVEWEQFVAEVMQSSLQVKLYVFLKHMFSHWPLNDSNFRMVLETWLSYVQPWRYISFHNEEREVCFRLDETWLPFIAANLLFYTQLLWQFIQRINRSDLAFKANALMLYRVAKSFDVENLVMLIQEVTPVQANVSQHISRANLLATQFNHLEGPGFRHESLLSPSMISMVSETIHRIDAVLVMILEKALSRSSRIDKSLLLFSWCSNEEEYPEDKLDNNLKTARAHLLKIFKLDPAEFIFKRKSLMKSAVLPSSLPDHDVLPSGEFSPTNLGRHQMISKLRAFPIRLNTPPALRPICSMECAPLVRILYKFTTHFNHQFSSMLEGLKTNQSYTSRVLKRLLDVTNMQENSEPRLHLRWLASYRLLLPMLLIYVAMCVVLKFSVVSLWLLIVFLYLSLVMILEIGK